MDRDFHQQLLKTKFSFGKHRGKSIARVIEEDMAYCEWLQRQIWFKKNNTAFQQLLLKATG